MSGHELNKSYNVPRTLLELPDSAENLANKLFKGREEYKRQQSARYRDNGKTANNFLNNTLLFLAEVVVQDGAFLLASYPSHEISTILKNSIPGYETWARVSRQKVHSNCTQFEEEKYRSLIWELRWHFKLYIAVLSPYTPR